MPLIQEITRGIHLVQQRRRRCGWCGEQPDEDQAKFCSHRCELEKEYRLST